MTKEEIMDLKYGTPIQAGPFEGLLWRVSFVVSAELGDIWRIWFIDQSPVRNADVNAGDIKIIEDGSYLRRQDNWEDCD